MAKPTPKAPTAEKILSYRETFTHLLKRINDNVTSLRNDRDLPRECLVVFVPRLTNHRQAQHELKKLRAGVADGVLVVSFAEAVVATFNRNTTKLVNVILITGADAQLAMYGCTDQVRLLNDDFDDLILIDTPSGYSNQELYPSLVYQQLYRKCGLANQVLGTLVDPDWVEDDEDKPQPAQQPLRPKLPARVAPAPEPTTTLTHEQIMLHLTGFGDHRMQVSAWSDSASLHFLAEFEGVRIFEEEDVPGVDFAVTGLSPAAVSQVSIEDAVRRLFLLMTASQPRVRLLEKDSRVDFRWINGAFRYIGVA